MLAYHAWYEIILIYLNHFLDVIAELLVSLVHAKFTQSDMI